MRTSKLSFFGKKNHLQTQRVPSAYTERTFISRVSRAFPNQIGHSFLVYDSLLPYIRDALARAPLTATTHADRSFVLWRNRSVAISYA